MRYLILNWCKYLSFYFLLHFVSPGCDRINNHPIPDVGVYFTINLIIENALMVPGNSVYFPLAGYGGVIISCEQPGSVYYAFDAACPNEAIRSCRVLRDEPLDNCPCLLNNLTLTCTCCESQFLVFNGTLIRGPATTSLKQYNVTLLNNATTLLIYN